MIEYICKVKLYTTYPFYPVIRLNLLVS